LEGKQFGKHISGMQSSPKEREDQQDLRKRSRRKVRREPCKEKERRIKAPDR
jgi:hypothetical protein